MRPACGPWFHCQQRQEFQRPCLIPHCFICKRMPTPACCIIRCSFDRSYSCTDSDGCRKMLAKAPVPWHSQQSSMTLLDLKYCMPPYCELQTAQQCLLQKPELPHRTDEDWWLCAEMQCTSWRCISRQCMGLVHPHTRAENFIRDAFRSSLQYILMLFDVRNKAGHSAVHMHG